MIEDEITPISAQLGQLDYELDSQIDNLHIQVDGRIDVVAGHVAQLDRLSRTGSSRTPN